MSQVTDYLLKRGFTRTEEVFRKESANLGPDGKPIDKKAVYDLGAKKYAVAFRLLSNWIANNLDIYKASLSDSIFRRELTTCEGRAQQDSVAYLRLLVS